MFNSSSGDRVKQRHINIEDFKCSTHHQTTDNQFMTTCTVYSPLGSQMSSLEAVAMIGQILNWVAGFFDMTQPLSVIVNSEDSGFFIVLHLRTLDI